MMLPTPRIVVVDDNKSHVQAILDGLHALGAAALGLHYPQEEELPSFPCLRVLFLDLFLKSGIDSVEQIKNTINLVANLITTDNGPYVIVLWTGNSDEGGQFEQEVQHRLSHPEVDLPLPLAVISLDKNEYIDSRNTVLSPERLRDDVRKRIDEIPQLAALLDWEEHVSRAAGDAMAQIMAIVRRTKQTAANPADDLNRVLGELAVAAAGYPVSDVFRSTNEVLVQVVTDRLLHRSASHEVRKVWDRAVTDLRRKSSLTQEDAGRLNRFLHIDAGVLLESTSPWERGSVLDLPEKWSKKGSFTRKWGYREVDLIKEEYGLTVSPRAKDKKNLGEDQRRWVLVQIQAPCDQAQQNRGLLPYVLGLSLVPSKTWYEDKARKKPALWLTPRFFDESSELRCLAIHLRFVIGLSRREVKKLHVNCRLREHLLTDLTHELRSYGGRPGIIRFPR